MKLQEYMQSQTTHIHQNQRESKRRQAESCHRQGPKTVPAQTAEITKYHVIFISLKNSE